MKKLFSLSNQILVIPVFILVFALVSTARSEPTSVILQERFKASVNHMVEQVQESSNPDTKREIIGKFLTRTDQRLGMAAGMIPAGEQPAVNAVRAKIELQYDELNGLNGREKVADADLNAFAQYIQQDAEQADAYWTGNGLYIGVGTLILILILILILR